MATRKVVKSILESCGLTNKFTMRTIGFSDLARTSVQEVTIKGWMTLAQFENAKRELASVRCICHLDGHHTLS